MAAPTTENQRLPRAFAILGGAIVLGLIGAHYLGFVGLGPKVSLALIVGAALLAIPAWSDVPRVGAFGCLVVAAWLGAITGFVEVAHRGLFKYGSMFKNIPREFVWLVPLTYTTLFVAVAAVPATLSALGVRVITAPAVVVPLVALGVWTQLLLYPILHPLAMLALAAGVGVQVARSVARHHAAFATLTRRTTPLLLAGIPLAAGILAFGRWEERTLSNLPEPAPNTPNVLLIVLDTVRADHLQPYGYERDTTPTIAALAESGTTFENAFSASPWTLPSHVTMFTGLYPHQFGADWSVPFDRQPPTLAGQLSARGYATAGFVSNLGYCTWGQGLDEGFARYRDFFLDPSIVAITTNLGKKLATLFLPVGGTHEYIRNSAERTTDEFLAWLDQPRDRPFFAFLNYFDAHAFYLAPPGYDTMYGPKSPLIRRWYTQQTWPPEEMKGFVDAYDGCIRYIDDNIARIVAHLRQNELLDDTVIIVTSDHGELFGEHDLIDHGNSLYLPLLHVPLVVSWPRKVPAGRRVGDLVSLRDLAATIQDVTGGPTAARLPGASLAPLWMPGGSAKTSPCLAKVSEGINREPWQPITRGPMRALFEGQMHYIRNGDDVIELYDFLADRAELKNLADTDKGKVIGTRMATTVDQLFRR